MFVLVLFQQKLVRDFYKILNQVSTEEIPDGLKLPESYGQLVSEMKSKKYKAKDFALIIKGMVCGVSQRYDFIFSLCGCVGVWGKAKTNAM